MSTNPPLTEDQIRQSEEAAARHDAAQTSRRAHLDYVIEQQRQQVVAEQINRLAGPSEEEIFRAHAGITEDAAHAEARAVATVAQETDTQLQEMIATARRISADLRSGGLSPDDARETLAALHEQRRHLAGELSRARARHERAAKIAEDPGMEVQRLRDKYAGLNR